MGVAEDYVNTSDVQTIQYILYCSSTLASVPCCAYYTVICMLGVFTIRMLMFCL